MKKIEKFFFLIVCFLIILNIKPSTTEISTSIHSLKSSRDSKTILLVAGHGEGNNCNHASTTINGITYYENIEARKMIDLIAQYFDKHDVKYEIANQIVGDKYWSDDESERETARTCTNPNNGTCCGFRTATIGNYSNILAAHVDSMGGKDYYSMVFELHFNAGGGSYTLMLGRDYVLRENGEKVAKKLASVLGIENALYEIDQTFIPKTLGTFSIYYEARKIPTYYLETVFMDNKTQFQSYLNNQKNAAESIAKSLIEIAPNSVGNGGNQYIDTGTIGGALGGLTYDPYSDYYMKLKLISDDTVTCTNIFMKNGTELNDLGLFMKDLYFLIKITAITLVIVLSSIDLFKYLVNDENKKKIISSIIKRLVIALIIFFLPDILDLLFHLFGLYDLSSCGIT